VAKAGFTVMIQKQNNNCCGGTPTITKSERNVAADPEFNKEHAHFIFGIWGSVHVNLFLLTLQSALTFTVTFGVGLPFFLGPTQDIFFKLLKSLNSLLKH
jgi:hypothetical protein